MTKPQRIVDPHIHLWSLSSGWNPSLAKKPEAAIDDQHGVGDYSKLLGRDFLLRDYFHESRNFNVTKVVHVTASEVPPSWPAETRWLQSLFEADGHPHGIIGWTDLRRPLSEIDRELGEHCESRNFRGVRNHEGVDYRSEHTAEAFAIMARRGLIYDMVTHEDSHADAARMALRFSGMQFVVEHTGWPSSAAPETFRAWRTGLKGLAAAPNTSIKISGLGMVMHRWSVGDFRPWVLACIEAFGVDRCMFASNFPVDSIYSSYDALFEAFAEIVSEFSPEDVDRLFASNAERIYRI